MLLVFVLKQLVPLYFQDLWETGGEQVVLSWPSDTAQWERKAHLHLLAVEVYR